MEIDGLTQTSNVSSATYCPQKLTERNEPCAVERRGGEEKVGGW